MITKSRHHTRANAGIGIILFIVMTTTLVAALVGACAGAWADDTSRTGTASWYSYESCRAEGTSGLITASGERFDHNTLTCASWDYKFGTMLKVTHIKTGKSVLVKVNDRGPAKRLHRKGRIIDLSKAAFAKLAPLSNGVIKIRVERI